MPDRAGVNATAPQNATAPHNATGAAAGAAAGGHGSGSYPPLSAEAENDRLSKFLLLVCGCVALAVLTWVVANVLIRHVRRLVSLNNETQRYFALPSAKFSFVKRNILYAPISRKRHNREMQLSAAVNMGTLPTRLQLLFLVGYFTTNLVFCLIDIPFHANFDSAASQLRNRSGVLAVVNMIPLFIMAGRNNPLIGWLNMSFDTFNLLHRWFGRIVILEALTHTLAFLIPLGVEKSWALAFSTALHVPYMMYGFVATCAFLAIGIQAASPIRHAFYETFKILHIVLAALAIAGVYYHLGLKFLPQIQFVYPVITIWIVDRVARFVGSCGSTSARAAPRRSSRPCRATPAASR